MQCCVDSWKQTDVSDVRTVPIIRAMRAVIFILVAGKTRDLTLTSMVLDLFGAVSLPLKLSNKPTLAVPLHVMEALGGRGGIAPTHS